MASLPLVFHYYVRGSFLLPFPIFVNILDSISSAPANYDFSGTQSIATIDPIRTDSRDSVTESRDDIAKDGKLSFDSPIRKDASRSEVSMEKWQQGFRKAAISSISLTLIVMVVS